MYTCPICSKAYVWPYDLTRHMKSKHGTVESQEHPQHPQQQQQQHHHHPQQQQQQQQHPQQQHYLFHPFTMIVSGPTSCGKTYLVKQVLAELRIKPTPHRILWLYRRWQPLYDEIKKTVYPMVEFYQGIPSGLEKDYFLNPNVRNVIVLDDLMSTASKDARITDLFMEGSHHRNLSVIALNQNLYYSKDPTQRRNCHYLVLFNNPVDKQPVMTLARQMYPQQPQYLLQTFEQATRQPYGYLLVDLKPHTDSANRLRPNAFWNEMKETSAGKRAQFETDLHCEKRCEEEEVCKMPVCDDCGLLFQDRQDLQKHLKTWCPGRNDGPPGLPESSRRDLKRVSEDTFDPVPWKKPHMLESCDYCGIVFKDNGDLQKHLHDNKCTDDDDDETKLENAVKNNMATMEEEGIKRMYKRVQLLEKDFLEDRKEKYRKRNMSEELIQEKLDRIVWRSFKETYGRFMKYLYFMQHGPKTQELLKSIDDKNNIENQVIAKLYKYKSWVNDIMDGDDDVDDDDITDSDEEEADADDN